MSALQHEYREFDPLKESPQPGDSYRRNDWAFWIGIEHHWQWNWNIQNHKESAQWGEFIFRTQRPLSNVQDQTRAGNGAQPKEKGK